MSTQRLVNNDDPLQALEDELRRRWPVRIETIQVDNWKTPLWCVADPNTMVDELIDDAAQHDADWEPYWAETWASSLDCAETLLRAPLNNQQVLDLGCGLGLLSALCASQGAVVCMMDNAQPALQFARRNTWNWRDRVKVCQADWNHDALDRRFNWIVGGDILYDIEQWRPLESFWKAHLAPNGQLLLGEPNRTSCRVFDGWLREQGWRVSSQSARHGRVIQATR